MDKFMHISDTSFPDVSNVNVFEYKNDFDFSKFNETQMTIKVTQVPWDLGEVHVGLKSIPMGNVVAFESNEERDSYLDSLYGITFATRYRAYHELDEIKLPIPYESVVLNNYIVIDYEKLPVEYGDMKGVTRWLYFIRSARAESANSTICEVARDTWTMFSNDIEISYMMLARGHAPMFAAPTPEKYLESPIDNNEFLLAEDVDFGSFGISSECSSFVINDGAMNMCIATTSYPVGDWGSKDDNTWRVPSFSLKTQDGNLSSYIFSVEKGMESSLFESIANYFPQFAQTVQGVFFVPDKLLDFGENIELFGVPCKKVNSSEKTFEIKMPEVDDFGFDENDKKLTKLYTFPYSEIELTDENGNSTEIKVEDCAGTLSLRTSLSLAWPWIRVSSNVNGVGSKSSNSVTFHNLSKHEFTHGGRWFDFLKEWDIPIMGIYQGNGNTNDYLTHFSRLTEKENGIRSIDASYENAVNTANNDESTAIATADTILSNSKDSYTTDRDNDYRTAATEKTNADASADAEKSNSYASAATAKTNADASADTEKSNSYASAATAKTNADASADAEKSNSYASAATAKTNADASADAEYEKSSNTANTNHTVSHNSANNLPKIANIQKAANLKVGADSQVAALNDVDLANKLSIATQAWDAGYSRACYNVDYSAEVQSAALGIGGGILGSAASGAVTGAGVGSVLPGAGTVAGAVAGGVVGLASGVVSGVASGVSSAIQVNGQYEKVELTIQNAQQHVTDTNLNNIQRTQNQNGANLDNITTQSDAAISVATQNASTAIINADEQNLTDTKNIEISRNTAKSNATRDKDTEEANANRTKNVVKNNATRDKSTEEANADRTSNVTKNNATRDKSTEEANADRTSNVTKNNATRDKNTSNENTKNTYGTLVKNAERSNTTSKSNATSSKNTSMTNAKNTKDTSRRNLDESIENQINEASIMAPNMFGSFEYGESSTTKPMGLFVNVVTQSRGAIKQAATQFKRFGYCYNQMWQFKTFNIGKRFSYWQADDIWMTAKNLPDAYVDQIRNYLLQGVTVWRRPEFINNTSLDENF